MIRRKNPPYSGTTVDPAQTKAQIEKLLRSYGVDGVQWSEIYSKNKVQLQFILTTDAGRQLLVRLEPPPFSSKRRSWVALKGRYEIVDAPNWAQSYRLLYSYLKAKLESVAYGLRDIEEEFLADVVVRDAQGREQKVSELVAAQLDAGTIRPALGPGAPAPPATAEGRKGPVLDAEHREVDQ